MADGPPDEGHGCCKIFLPDAAVLQVVELDPGNTAMAAKVRRLEPIVADRREKMKEEMMGACCARCDNSCEMHAVQTLTRLVVRRQAS